MPLFKFNPNDYGAEYYVMAETKEIALRYLKSFLICKSEDLKNPIASIYADDYNNLWKDATIYNLPNRYSIDTFTSGEVAESERS